MTDSAQTPETAPYKDVWATSWPNGVTIFDVAVSLEERLAVARERIAALEAEAEKRAKWNEELAKANDRLSADNERLRRALAVEKELVPPKYRTTMEAALAAAEQRTEALVKAIKQILDEPHQTLSDAKALTEMVRIAKAAVRNKT